MLPPDLNSSNPTPQTGAIPPVVAPQSPVLPPTVGEGSPKSMKKILAIAGGFLAIVIVILLAVSFFLSRNKAVEQKDEVELVWWGLWEDTSIIEPIIKEYEESHPKTKIKYTVQSKEDYRERLTSALASGTGPDIFRLHNTWVPMFARSLTPLPASIMSAQEFGSTFYPVAGKDLTISTGIVGIPLEFDGMAMFINEELFTTFALTPPKTWDEFKVTAKALTITNKAGEIEQAGAAVGFSTNIDHWEDIVALIYLQNGADLALQREDRAQGALTFYTDLGRVGKVWDESLPPSTIAFAGGNVAIYFGPSWRVFDIQKLNPNLDFRILPMPQILKEEKEPDIMYASYWFEGVSNKSQGQAQAWDFLKFMSSKESLEKLYANASKTRAFGEPYSRVDMRELLLSDPMVGPFLELAPTAQSWYLASKTFDGETGINSQLSTYFNDAVTEMVRGGDINRASNNLDKGVAQVMKQYGITVKK